MAAAGLAGQQAACRVDRHEGFKHPGRRVIGVGGLSTEYGVELLDLRRREGSQFPRNAVERVRRRGERGKQAGDGQCVAEHGSLLLADGWRPVLSWIGAYFA